MKGLEKINKDLKEAFKQAGTERLKPNNFISISYINYHFTNKYGSFDDCYVSLLCWLY